MKLENQVCSLPLAQRLKELGVKQEGYFNWKLRGDAAKQSWGIWNECEESECATSRAIDECSAFTVAELGEMLPRYIQDEQYEFIQDKDAVMYGAYGVEVIELREEAETEADARAAMLIYLLKNNLLP